MIIIRSIIKKIIPPLREVPYLPVDVRHIAPEVIMAEAMGGTEVEAVEEDGEIVEVGDAITSISTLK